jgi:ribosomal protein S18 acetylase RimI-like enzyme
MTDSMTAIRVAVPGDASGIARVHVDSWRETYSGLLPDQFFNAAALAGRRAMWVAILGHGPVPGTVVVAERDREIRGFAFAGPASHPDATKGIQPARSLHLFSIYVLAADHDTGTGHRLLEAAIGDRPAQLWVARDNDRARTFYRRHGFCEDGATVADADVENLVEVRMVR